jgi:serine/threonine protein kinase
MSVAAVSAPAQAEASVGAAALPTHIGKYRILGRLGDGATSEVFLGHDDFQQRNVAIKRVRASGDPADGH